MLLMLHTHSYGCCGREVPCLVVRSCCQQLCHHQQHQEQGQVQVVVCLVASRMVC